ncbi:hypothetical protein [Variovorax sp. E3]|uniref:hypothetical protein n=1 Tax=Variovorax sp. E3 TaxID=1914993 RepID=UPI0018DD8A33|nr:hypothetical protein [Variovorax sp. E3]
MRQMRWIRYVFYLLLPAILLACSHIDEITPRSYVALVVSDTASLRDEIAQTLVAGQSVSVRGELAPEPKGEGLKAASVDFGWVTHGGSVVIHNKKYGVVVIQEPILSKEGVTWSCIVYPVESKPNVCGTASRS